MDIVTEQFSKLLKEKLSSHIKQIFLFGSRARGDNNEWSDYDFAIIVDKKDKYIENMIDEITGDLFYGYSKLIGPIVLDEKEWEFHKKLPIGVNIMRDGILL